MSLINNLASRGFFFGDCKTGFDCAKHSFFVPSVTTIVSQSLNLPTFFISWAEASETIKKQNNNTVILLIRDMDLDIFFELR